MHGRSGCKDKVVELRDWYKYMSEIHEPAMLLLAFTPKRSQMLESEERYIRKLIRDLASAK